MEDNRTQPIQVEALTQARVVALAQLAAPALATPTIDPVFDRDDLLERIGYNTELLHELIDLWHLDAARLLDDLRAAIAAGDASEVKAAAHTMKGAVGNFGAYAAMTMASHLEALGQAGDFRAAADLLPALEAELERLPLALRQLLDALISDSREVRDAALPELAAGAGRR